jgi:opacity protein-like surface antigen
MVGRPRDRRTSSLKIGLLSLALAMPVAAQVPVLSAAGGLSVPTSRYGRPLDVGFNVQASGDIQPMPGPLEFRGDVLWSRFAVGNPGSGSSNVVGGTLDAVLRVPSPGLSPYVLGGIGAYDVEVGNNTSHHSRFGTGLNIGGGVRFALVPFLHMFIETRYHVVYASPFGGNTTFVPIVVGVRLH